MKLLYLCCSITAEINATVVFHILRIHYIKSRFVIVVIVVAGNAIVDPFLRF